MRLFDITEEDRKLNELFIASIDEETGEIKDSEILEQLEVELKEALARKSDGIIKIFREQEENINGTENEIKRLQKLKQGREKALERFKDYIKFNLKNMDIKTIETTLGKIILKETPAVDPYDENLIPKEFMKEKIEYKPMKREIKKAIDSGIEVPGARIVMNTSLTIK